MDYLLPARCGLAAVALLAGCGVFMPGDARDARDLLRSATPTRDSLAIEILWIRFPEDDPTFTAKIWSQVDEQRISTDLRRILSRNGLRAGVLGGGVPDEIASTIAAAGAEKSPEVALGVAPARVRRRIAQLARSEHCEIQASPIYDELSWLKADADGVRGDQLFDAQCIYRVHVDSQSNSRVTVELTPEIQSGPPMTQIASKNQGGFRYVSTRQRQVFDDLRVTLPLSAGEMLLVTSLADMPGSLGHWFHTSEEADKTVRKLVLIRLAQVPASDLFSADPAPPGST